MNRIVGYTDRPSVEPGGEIGCHVSALSDHVGVELEYESRLVRIVGFDAEGGTEKTEPVASDVDARRVARVETTSTGSYGVASVPLREDGAEDLRAEITFMPTLLDGREQALLGICEWRNSQPEELSLAIEAGGGLVLILGGAELGTARFALPGRVRCDRWYRLSGGFRPGEAFASATAIDDPDFEAVDQTWELASPPGIREPTAHLACRPEASPENARLGSKFTGRLEAPSLWAGERALASWDLGQGPEGFAFEDNSGNGNHGELHGLPMRAVTGSNWDGRANSFKEAPEGYRAVHFFADAIEDAGWPQAFSWRVPDQLRSGVYAFVIERDEDREAIPFVVSPGTASPADILLVLPTATYMAYGNARFMWEKVLWEVQRERSVVLGREEQILLGHPEFGASSYDQYLDGSNITYISWRRPNLDMRVDQCRGEAYPCDLRLIDWLERRGYSYDVCSDDDLDRGGIGLLGSYRAALTGTHPEYASGNCYAALEAFLRDGGRLAVLGGDVYTWLVAFSRERPWIMEVRKPDNRAAGSRAAAEAHLALTGEYSGEPDRPRPAAALLGTSSASMGFDAPRPYERLPDPGGPDTHFVFEGVERELIGDDSIEGGVVFQEWDNTEGVTNFATADSPPKVLARSGSHSVTTRWFGAGKRRNHAEMTFFSTEGGGAVFSVNSMSWCLCLGRRDVDAITSNVIDRFLDTAPFEPAPASERESAP